MDGRVYFVVVHRETGYPQGIFDREQVRAHIKADPEGWEHSCIRANASIDKWEAEQTGNYRFYIKYLPFLQDSEHRHERVEHQGRVSYHLYFQGTLVYADEMDRCVSYWSNIRAQNWSAGSQQNVAKWVYYSMVGWGQQQQQQQPTEPQPSPPGSPDFRPQSPTDYNADDMDTRDERTNEPTGVDGNTSDINTVVGSANGNQEDDSDDDDSTYAESSGGSGFSSDIIDIFNNNDEYTITQGGNSAQYPDGTRDDDEYEWRTRSPSPAPTPISSADEYDYSDDAVEWWDDGRQPNDPIVIHGSDSEESDNDDDSDDDNGYGGRNPVETTPNALQLEYRGRTYQYAFDRSSNRPLFWYGTRAEQRKLTNAWERNELRLPPLPIQCQQKWVRRDGYESSEGGWGSRCDTPDIYDANNWD
jgi:hypothetical protein